MRFMLSIEDHRRDRVGLRYVYPVISRRAGGVSVGINLNVNNACNWACVYCQVDNLTKGGPPPVDLQLLEHELSSFLQDALYGDFMQLQVPEASRQLVDVAFSGNGEPTSAPEFSEVVGRVANVLRDFDLYGKLPVRLITNGSLLHRPTVQVGVAQLGEMGGEVWFKVDRGDAAGVEQVNGVDLAVDRVQRNLASCLARAPTWVQTCWFAYDGESPSRRALEAYCQLLHPFADELSGIHLYGLARPSLQAASMRLTRISREALSKVAENIQKKTGIRVLVSP